MPHLARIEECSAACAPNMGVSLSRKSIASRTASVNIRPASVATDPDPIETSEWLDSLGSVVRNAGPVRAQFLLQRLEESARRAGVSSNSQPFSAYRNTISLERQGRYPGDLAREERLTSIMRWNALAMVVRANKAYGELGGHIASYASAAEIFETGFNHFFRARTPEFGGDLVYF